MTLIIKHKNGVTLNVSDLYDIDFDTELGALKYLIENFELEGIVQIKLEGE